MGIKTLIKASNASSNFSLKNLPTTWGLRQLFLCFGQSRFTLKNLPTTWGLRL